MKLAKTLLFIVGAYAAMKLVFGVLLAHPLPSSLITMYMFFIVVGTLIAVTFTEDGARELVAPLRSLFVEERLKNLKLAAMVAVPIAAGAAVYLYTLSHAEPPARLRTIHPAPPATFAAFGKSHSTDSLENPYRAVKATDGAAYSSAVKEGEAVYFKNCHFCHGAALDGKGRYAASLSPLPTDFTDPGTIAQLKESYLFWRISTGGPGLPKGSAPGDSAMPAWGDTLTEDETWKVITFLYDRTGKEPRAWK